jgi:hypothetical protein
LVLWGGGLLVLGEGLGEPLGLVVLGVGVGVLVSAGLLDGLGVLDLTEVDGDGVVLGVELVGVVEPLPLGVAVAVLVFVALVDGLGLLLLEALCDGVAEFDLVVVRLDGVAVSVVVLVRLGVAAILARWWLRRCRRCPAAGSEAAGRLAPAMAVSAAAFGWTRQATR